MPSASWSIAQSTYVALLRATCASDGWSLGLCVELAYFVIGKNKLDNYY